VRTSGSTGSSSCAVGRVTAPRLPRTTSKTVDSANSPSPRPADGRWLRWNRKAGGLSSLHGPLARNTSTAFNNPRFRRHLRRHGGDTQVRLNSDTRADSALGAWPPCHPAKLGWERNRHPATPAAGSPATLPVRPAGAPCEAHARASNRGARPRPCTGGALAADVGCAPSLTHHKCSSARVVVGELTRVSASLAGLWSPEFA
jgi:hypothetical protein